MRKQILILGIVALVILGFWGCSKNKFKITRSEPKGVPYYNPSNDTCYVCHSDPTLKKKITTSLGIEIVPLYVNREKFARSIHRGIRCLDCHTDIVFRKGHSEVPKIYGGWANFSAENTLLTRNYTTQASISCANCKEHADHADFLSSQHYLIEDLKNSRKKPHNGIEIGKDYDVAKCGKCHLTCATCHFKGAKVQTINGEITDPPYWSDLLNGVPVQNAEGLTNWAIDWTTNVESHDFADSSELSSSNDLCRVCHTGYYTQYGVRGFPDSDTLVSDMVTSQGVAKYPQYEEWSFLSGNIPVNPGGYLDTLYSVVGNRSHYRRLCVDCHNRPPADIHSLVPISCLNCHPDKKIPSNRPHPDVACVACHDATMNVYRVKYSKFPPADTVRVAAIKDNKVINWHSHMIINPEEITNFCNRRCHNSVTGPTIGANWNKIYSGDPHN